ncbi:HipA domain-containing protein [Niveispirillum sp.]|uniref:type II toxin-antitoxin system HipA family toxin n=1 Tax=Niveispirillum sp. TaxID=1917217 RepID=UPI001B6DDE3B|nr:HipA domain-containing protein [Niveispirillum sp.]MBP7338299.1 HipA domain-containing protein [Niveispirillum sp.]
MRTAQVLFKGQRAGLLRETAAGGSQFVYDPGWTQDIGCCLPVSSGAHPWPAGLHPFFQHLGPEGWLRERQARAGRIEDQDDLGLLLRYGADCIGAVSVLPLDGAATPADPATWPDDIPPGRTVSGVQRKLLAFHEGRHFHPATADSPATHIAKFNHASNDGLVRNEFLSLSLAAHILGIDQVTSFRNGFVEGYDEPCLLITRFDRADDGTKLRMEDFAQILARPRGNDNRGKYDGSYEEVAEAISRHSARPEIDLDRFFRQLVTSALIGNADAHLKNFSLLERPEGMRLSPAYDLLNTLIYGGRYDRHTALALAGVRQSLDQIDAALLLTFAKNIGLPKRAARRALRELATRAANSAKLIPPAGEGADGFVHLYADIVHAACARVTL